MDCYFVSISSLMEEINPSSSVITFSTFGFYRDEVIGTQ
jgi:hypothetical protein